MKKEGTILVVDDNHSILTAVELLLMPYFDRVITLNSPNLIPTTLRENPAIDVVLLDMNFSAGVNSGGEGLYWLKEIKAARPEISVVLFTAFADVDLAVKAIKEGACDFVQKPWENAQLLIALQNALKLRLSEKKIKNLQASHVQPPDMFWGVSESMQRLHEAIEKVAPTDANILLMGENGTGKEMISREIHRLSPRASELLVSVDMGSIAETLFESELFGHVRGAFTDAKADRTGKFEVADTGTLFLDEIGNLPLHLQAKLLVVLQNRAVTKVGGNFATPINIRLICATNHDIESQAESGEFRQDLLYRINTITLRIPPLRERVADIVPLSELFLKRYSAKYGKIISGIAPDAAGALMAASWKGNVRELQHAVEKAVIMSEGGELTAADFMLFPTRDTDLGDKNPLVTIEQMEKQLIERALRRAGGENLSAVAFELGITRQTLYNKIKKLGISDI